MTRLRKAHSKRALLFTVLLLAAALHPISATGQQGLEKQITSGPDTDTDGLIDVVVEVGQLVTTEYDFDIIYSNPGGPAVLIVDTVPAEWIVTEIAGSLVDVACGESQTVNDGLGGSVDVFKGGKPDKKCQSATHIQWTPDPSGSTLNVVATTRQSPGKGNDKFAPTSCGALFLNDGAVAFELDPATGEPKRDPTTGELAPPLFESTRLTLVAVEDLNGGGVVPDGSGDEDGDNVTDLQEILDGTDPCIPDTADAPA